MLEMKEMKAKGKMDLKHNFILACKEEKFKRLVATLKCPGDVAMKYTSSLEDTVQELNNCDSCKGIAFCKNRLEGHVYYPECKDEKIIFSYAPCKYFKEMKANETSQDDEIKNASFKDIDISDNKRTKVIRWLTNFCKEYEPSKKSKGLFLHGSFGSGKTYLISALFNELKKKNINSEIVYYPELLSDIKEDFDNYGNTMNYLKEVDLLLIDDIGAEKVTEWSRDEILGTILQSRMNNYKTTFFTSNLNIEELEQHLRASSYSDDQVKARRIIERIKQLTIDLDLVSENRRK